MGGGIASKKPTTRGFSARWVGCPPSKKKKRPPFGKIIEEIGKEGGMVKPSIKKCPEGDRWVTNGKEKGGKKKKEGTKHS